MKTVGIIAAVIALGGVAWYVMRSRGGGGVILAAPPGPVATDPAYTYVPSPSNTNTAASGITSTAHAPLPPTKAVNSGFSTLVNAKIYSTAYFGAKV